MKLVYHLSQGDLSILPDVSQHFAPVVKPTFSSVSVSVRRRLQLSSNICVQIGPWVDGCLVGGGGHLPAATRRETLDETLTVITNHLLARRPPWFSLAAGCCRLISHVSFGFKRAALFLVNFNVQC